MAAEQRERRATIIRQWEAEGRPLPVPAQVKHNVVARYGAEYNLRTLIETGTYRGGMINAQRRNFDVIHSIELDADLHKHAQERFKDFAHITLHHGDSSEVLPNLLPEIRGPALFWLDGHFSGGATAKGERNTPILKELSAILERAKGDVILIDDIRLFTGEDDYPTVSEIERLLAANGYKVEVARDILRATPNESKPVVQKKRAGKKTLAPARPRWLAPWRNWGRERKLRRQFETFRSAQRGATRQFQIDWRDRSLCYEDDLPSTPFPRHYVLHTAWAARVLARYRPAQHIDISSNLYFNVACSAFVPIQFYDYRPVDLRVPGLTCSRADLTRLDFETGTIASISCMHVVEHVGLGRYGEPLDFDGDAKAMAELSRVVARGGLLLFVVPVGQPRIQFNAHRIYSYEQIVDQFTDFELADLALIPDGKSGELIDSPTREQINAQRYGCGCFLFRKR